MAVIGKRIKALRTALGLTQKQLAEELHVSIQSIYRYETTDTSIAQEILIELANFFDVSTDYFLGLVPFEKQLKEEQYKILPNGKYNAYYRRYLDCRSIKNIEVDSSYYWIFISEGNCFGGLTQWTGWADDKYSLEIRKLRNVDPTKAYAVCTRQFGKPLLINRVEDIDIFYLLGGHALVKAEVCEKYMPEFSQNFIAKSHA